MSKLQRSLYALLVVLVIILAGTTVVFYRRYNEIKQNPQKVAQDSVNKLLAEVGEIMILPTGEIPTIATVVDPSKLKDQPFFAKAKVGDKVLIYASARKAIMYDPVARKIVEVAPLTIGNPAPQPAARQPETGSTTTP